MEVAAVEESDGGTSAAPAELPKREGAVVAETDHTSAEQPCKHFSICGYVSQKMDAKFCSLSQSFSAQQQLDERHNSLHPFSVAKFRRWDCSVCLDEVKILDDRTTSRAVFTAKNVSGDGCSIRFVQSTLVPTSVDFRSLFPCTQLLAQEKNPDRSALLKSNIENNSKCNSPYEAKTDPPMKDNACVDIMALPEDSQIRVSREGNAIAIPSSSKLSEASMKLDSEENGKNKEVPSADHTIPKVAKPISGQKGDQVSNSGPCEEAAPKRSIGSTYKKKKGKHTAQVGSSDVKVSRRKQIKLRLLSEIINTDPVGGSRSDVEVNGEKVADLCEDDRSTDDVPSVDHQGVGEILSKTTKNVAKDKGVDVEDDESSLMNWMKRIPKRLRTEKKDSEHKDCDSSASKSTADVFASKDTQDFLSSGWKLSKKNTLPTTSMQQGDENIQNDNLERNTQSTDDMRRMEAENSTERFLSNVKTISLSKRKMPPTASIQHDGVVPVSRQMLREISSKTAKKKAKYKGVDAVDDEGSSLMDWMKRIPKKLRTEKKDAEYKDNDSSAANSKYNAVDKVALKDVQDDFISSAQELSKRKIPPTASTREDDENIQNDNLEIDTQNINGMCETESDNCRQRSLSKVKKMSLCKSKIPSTVNAEHDDVNTKETAVLRTDDQCQMVPRKSVQRRLKKVSPGKHVIRNVTAFEQKLPKKRNKKKQEVMDEKNAMTDDIPMDIVELLARCQDKRPLITETDSADISRTQSKIMEDEDCSIIAAEDGPNYVSSVIDTTSQQKRPLEPDSYQNALQNRVAATTQATHTHALKLQTPGHVMSTQEPQAHSGMGELVTIAATSPLLSPDKDQPLAEATPERWSHMGAKKSMWEPFKALPRDLSTTTGCAQFRPSIDTVDLTYTDVAGANRYYPTRQPVISTLDHYTNRAVNSVQARNFPSSVSTMEAGNLFDGRNVGHSGFYPRETMPATHPLRLTESPMLASFNYEGSSRNQMEFQLQNSHYAQDQSIGSASTPYGAHNQYIGSASTLCEAHNHYIGSTSSLCGAHNQYIGSASTPYGSNLNGMGSASTQYGSNLNGMGSASTSYGSNLNGRVPLTLEDLSRHPLQPNLHRPLRPLPRVGVLSSLLQKEIADWSESCGTQSGYKIGVSKGITLIDINKRGNVEALNSGMYSAAWNARRLSSVSSSPGFSSVRNGTAQSWTRDQGRMTNPNPLDRLVRQDICVTNRNPCDFTTISDDNEYMRADI
uniref:Uncharacterized protein n=1 Tax=Aegilops tauschii subsp. strangulata TaxID=200361 RepID=A0A453EHZ7_AEGTS